MIKKYIQFAIDNWYKVNKLYYNNFKVECNRIKYLDKDDCQFWYDNLIETITSKEFIEAITKWYYWNNWSQYFEIITQQQARAIRDWKLEEFIKNILGE